MTPRPHPLEASTWHGLDTFSADPHPFYFLYTPSMADVDSKTKIVLSKNSKSVTNFMVWPQGEGFDLLFLHELKVTGSHVDEAEVILTWHFASADDMNHLLDKLTASVLKEKQTS